MIVAVYGTTGELIKLAPLLRALRDRGAPAYTVCTAQQPRQIPAMLDDLGVDAPDLWLPGPGQSDDLERAGDIPGWAFRLTRGVVGNGTRLRRRLHSDDRPPLVVVHGDTFTTVFGALLGRLLRAPVAHVEAGLRSGDIRNPFPEELDRRVTSLLARIHYAPGSWAAGNLRRARVRGTIVDTGGNTIRDALGLVAGPAAIPDVDLPPEFGLVSIHRFELLRSRPRLRALLEVLRDEALRTPLVFIDHPVTVRALSAFELDGLLPADRVHRVPRQRYVPFIALLKRSSWLVTDSGGCQEECAELGHPCLVHRAATERRDGLGGPVRLSRLDLRVVRAFLESPPRRVPAGAAAGSPTAAIVEHLVRAGFVAPSQAGGDGRAARAGAERGG